MTLKKFLKKYVEAFADVYNNGEYLGCSDILDIKYKEWRVDKVFSAYSKSDLRCGIVAINIEPPKEKKPKRSTDNDEIGLKDVGYAGDSADDYGCCDCKYTNLDSGSFPCNECSHAYIDKWESKE